MGIDFGGWNLAEKLANLCIDENPRSCEAVPMDLDGDWNLCRRFSNLFITRQNPIPMDIGVDGYQLCDRMANLVLVSLLYTVAGWVIISTQSEDDEGDPMDIDLDLDDQFAKLSIVSMLFLQLYELTKHYSEKYCSDNLKINCMFI